MDKKELSRIISYKSTLDISEVLSSVKQLQKEVSSKHNDVNLFNVDKELANLEKIAKQYKDTMSKGISSVSDAKEINRLGGQIESTISRIDKAFDKVDYDIAKNAKNALKETLHGLKGELQDVRNSFEKAFQSVFTNVKGKGEFKNIYKEAAQEGKNFQTVQKEILDNFDKQIEAAKKAVSKISGTTFSDLENFKNNPFGNGIILPTNIYSRTEKTEQNSYAAIQKIFLDIAQSEDTAEKKLEKFKEKLKAVGVELSPKQADSFKWFNVYADKLDELQDKASKVLNSREYTSATAALEKLETQRETIRTNNGLQNTYNQYSNLIGQVNDATKALDNFDESAAKIERGNLPQAFDSLSDAVSRETSEVMGLTTAQVQLDSTFNNLQNRLTQLLSIGTVYTELRQIIRQTYNDVKELDKAFGEIAMVTDYTVQDLWAQYDNYAAMANRLGQSTVSVIQASGLFYQQGMDTASALTLTEDTMKLATLAGLDFADATSQMTAAIRAFKLEMTDGSHVTDVYAELAAHAAADVQGIATAMSKTASIANSAGMSFENTATFLTTMIEATQEAPDNIGTALKTVIARFTELKENVAGTADSAFDDLDYNKVDKALKSVGISIKDVNGQFRNLDEVFLELGQKWSTLDRNTQRYIATIAAGSRQQSRFVALLDNYDRVKQLQEVATNAEGRADEQFAKFADTVEYKVNQLRNSWEQLRTTFMDSKTFKTALDGLNTLVNRINNFNVKDFLALGTAIMMVIKVVGKQLVEQFRTIASNAGKTFKNAFTGEIRKIDGTITIQTNISEIVQEMNNLKKEWDKIDDEIEANTLQIRAIEEKGARTKDGSMLSDKDKAELARLQKANEELEIRKLGIGERYNKEAFNKAKQEAKGRSIGQALAVGITAGITSTVIANNPMEAITPILVSGAGSAVTQLVSEFSKGGMAAGKAFLLGAGPSILAITLSIAAISASIVAVKNLWNEHEAKKLENRAEAAKIAAENAQKEAEQAKSTAKTERDTLTNLEKLKEEYTELNSKQIRTEEEQEKYNELVEKIKEDYPELVSYYDETTGQLSVQNELWDNLIEKQKASTQQAEKMAVLQRQIANNAEYTNANYTAITNASSRTGVSGGIIESNLGKSGSWGVTAEDLQSSEFASDIDKIAELTGVIAEDGVFTDQNYQDMADALNDGNSELRQSIDSANKEIEQNTKQLIQANAIALKDAYLAQNPNAGVGEQALVQAYGLTKDVVQDLSLNLAKNDFDAAFRQDFVDEALGAANNIIPSSLSFIAGGVPGWLLEQYLTQDGKGPNRGVSRALGLSRSKYADLEDEDIEFGGLRQYGIETVGEFKDALEKMAGSSAEAAKLWDETIDDEGKFIDLVEQVVINKVNTETLENIDSFFKSLKEEQITQLNDYQQELLDNGATQEELDKIKEFLIETGAEGYKIDISKVNEDIQNQLNEMSAKALAYGLKDADGWSTTQLTAWNEWIEAISDAIGIDAAKEFGANFAEQAQAAGLSPEQITAAFQSVDWGSITFDSIGDAKERFISTMQDAMGNSFDQAKVEQLWEKFFATAEKYNVVNVKIKSEDVMNSIRDQTLETYDKIISAAGSAQSAVKKQLTDGFINYSDYRELDKTLKEINLDVNDYVQLTKKGYVLNTNELAKAMGNQAANEEIILQQARDKIKLGVDELNNQITILEALVGEEEANDTILQQLNDKVSLTAQIAKNTLLAAGATEDEFKTIQESGSIKSLSKSTQENLTQALDDLKKQRDELQSYLTDDDKLRKALGTGQLEPVLKELYETFDTTMQDVAKSAEDNTDKISDAWKKVQEAQQKVIDKQKELKELTEGTAPHQTAGDPMYNYTTKLAQDAKQIDKLKEQIEDLSNPADRKDLLSQYTSAAHNEIVTREAQNQVYQQGANRILQTLRESLPKAMQQINSKYGLSMSTNFADYMQDLGNGRIGFQWSKFNDARIPQDVEKYFAEQIQAYDEQLDKIDENREAIEKRQKEFNEFYKKQLDEYVSLEDEVVNKLKEKYQEEIDNVKDKNEAIEDANNDYLDALEKAIDKERSLRDRQREWDDLATQEKKLSLMQRDTSGANRVETAKLEKDVEKQREDLLDKSVDDIINNLKELYETQQEAREAEVEYMEAMLDNAVLVREANEIITSWQSPEDAVNWWKSVTNMQELSTAKQEQEALKWQELYEKRENYLATSQEAFNDALQVSEAEIQLEVETTGDNVVASVDQNFASVINSVDEAIGQVVQDIADAKDAVKDALKDYYDLIKEDQEEKGKTLTQWANSMVGVLSNISANVGNSIASAIINNTNRTSSNQPKYDDRGFRLNDSTSTAKNTAEEMARRGNDSTAISNKDVQAIQNYVAGLTSATDSALGEKNGRNDILRVIAGDNNIEKLKKQFVIKRGSVLSYKLPDNYKEEGLKAALDYLDPYDNKSFLRVGKMLYAANDYDSDLLSRYIRGTDYKKFAKGGLVPYTGPAWVDGTPSRPEAFLSADDTERIGQLTQLLENIPFFNTTIPSDNISTTNIGDTTIEVNITIENVSSDYDVDQAVERVKQDIVDAARYTGSNVILKQ